MKDPFKISALFDVSHVVTWISLRLLVVMGTFIDLNQPSRVMTQPHPSIEVKRESRASSELGGLSVSQLADRQRMKKILFWLKLEKARKELSGEAWQEALVGAGGGIVPKDHRLHAMPLPRS